MVTGNVEDEFETEFGVYDLPEFLRAIDSFYTTCIEFQRYLNLKNTR